MKSIKRQLELAPSLPPNPVIPGDHPDPTIILLNGTFWASATSGEWSPQFPLFRSPDLLHWTPAGSIFPHQPAWAEGSFWAPELVHDEQTDRLLCWYVGRLRGGPLSIAVATANSPTEPWTDHGPLIADPDGSIDPCFARDEHGAPYLLWKEDGNSADRPTPIWAQRLTGDLLHLTGPRTQLITNDQPWEEGVVEGPYILKHEGLHGQSRFYLFYAGNSCCGRECKYAEGVARADCLLGPWEKFPGNPLIGPNEHWRCPGHGTAVHTGTAEDYLLYHAYPAEGSIFVGREAILDRIDWTAPEPDGKPGWPTVNAGQGPTFDDSPGALAVDFRDDFSQALLNPAWQWPVNTNPTVRTGPAPMHSTAAESTPRPGAAKLPQSARRTEPGSLTLTIPWHSPLSPRPVESAMLAVPRPGSMHYLAIVTMDLPETPNPALWSGLAVVGDPFNTVGLGLRGSELILWQRRGPIQQVLWRTPAPAVPQLQLRSASTQTPTPDQTRLQFSYSPDGLNWRPAGPPADASDLPAWDRGLRLALLLEGPLGASAVFRDFALQAARTPL